MELQLTVSAPDVAEEVASLHAWLNEESGLRGRVKVVEPVRSSEDMGALSDTLMIVLGSGGIGAGIASVLKTWLQHRSVDVTITAKSGEQSVEISAGRAKDAERMLRQVLGDADGRQ